MGELKKSTLIDYGFKLKSKGKKQFFINEDYGVRLEFTDVNKTYKNNSDVFIKEKGEEYNSSYDMSHLITKCNFKRTAEFFKAGLPEQNLRQGENAVFKENTQKEFGIITKEKATELAHAIFNYLISDGLMCSSGKPIYTYQILDYKYEYKGKESVPSVTFYYHLKDRRGWHEFHHVYNVFGFDDKIHGMSHPCHTWLSIDDFLNSFKK